MANYIAIIRDGKTDFEILKTLVKELAFHEASIDIPDEGFIDLTDLGGFKLNGAIKRYLKEADSSRQYGIYDPPAKALKEAIVLVLTKALAEAENQVWIPRGHFSHRDLIILSDDTDKKLLSSNQFLEEWAYGVNLVFALAIQAFYEDKTAQGIPLANLPLILPLLLFPSTEILVAAFRDSARFESYRNQEAPNLKHRLYQTTKLMNLNDTDLQDLALRHITEDKFEAVFRHLPEIRSFFYQIAHRNYA